MYEEDEEQGRREGERETEKETDRQTEAAGRQAMGHLFHSLCYSFR